MKKRICVILFSLIFICASPVFAQANQASNLKDLLRSILEGVKSKGTDPTTFSTPAPTSTFISPPFASNIPIPPGQFVGHERVVELTQTIIARCLADRVRGKVTTKNVTTCINEQVINAVAYSKIKSNTLYEQNTGFLQCVGFARGSFTMMTNLDLDHAGAAKNQIYHPPDGTLALDPTVPPQPGDLIVWGNGIYGHIAYVVEVNGAKDIVVAEANFVDDGTVGIRRLRFSVAQGVVRDDMNMQILGWIRKV